MTEQPEIVAEADAADEAVAAVRARLAELDAARATPTDGPEENR